jgi:hypothetical protein
MTDNSNSYIFDRMSFTLHVLHILEYQTTAYHQTVAQMMNVRQFACY